MAIRVGDYKLVFEETARRESLSEGHYSLCSSFLIADLISTVTVEPTREKIVSLVLLIVVRTFLSWSIAMEIEGCWPWQAANKRKA
jgi:uncharacterized membrane protein